MHSFTRSIINEDVLPGILSDLYGIPGGATARFWRTGIAGNDIYVVSTGSRKYLLKIYFKPVLEDQIRSSIEIMIYLEGRGLNVPKVHRTVDASTLAGIEYPEGRRLAALFEYIEGEEPDIQNDGDAKAIGAQVARMYRELDLLSMPFPVRRADFSYLVQSGIDGLRAYLPEENEKIEYLARAGRDLWRMMEESVRPSAPLYGLCHGDLHSGNMIKAKGGEIYLIDFDSCAYGYRVYDLGVYANLDWEAKTPEALRKDALALEKFLAGYRESMPLSHEEEKVFPYMLGLRHLELLGMVLRNCVMLEGAHWIRGCLKFHLAWFEDWRKTLAID